MNTSSNADAAAPRVAVIIPAYNEEQTVGAVAEVAQQARLVDEVIVVDNVSTDDTAAVARRAGARVIECQEKGKGQAMMAGVAATDADYICFLDADLLNLGSAHVDRLVQPVIEGTAGMSLALFDRGPELNPLFMNALPRLTGQRAMHRSLFEGLDLDAIKGYKVEAALNSRADELDLEIDSFVADELWHRTKEEKHRHGPVVGSLRKVAMLMTAIWSYVSYQVRRPFRRDEGRTVGDRQSDLG
ncbi:MAG: glycosyltransferase [Nitriliruptorales bacterium]|nr:glycosyltransferase [Nitriliruptorales bacterium]